MNQSSNSLPNTYKKFCIILLSFGFLLSCTKSCHSGFQNYTPEQIVEAYLDIALNMKNPSEKEKLLELTTGNLKAAIAQASDQVIMDAYVQKKYRINSYSVIERTDRTPRETEISFRLIYEDPSKVDGTDQGQAKPLITTDNRVALIRENKTWLIRDVVGQKTSIDFPLAAAARVEAKPGIVTPENSDSGSEESNVSPTQEIIK